MTVPDRNWLFVMGAFAHCACAPPGAARTYTAGDSMLPTVALGARVEVTPFEGTPTRGRVVVFRAPQRPDREYVKRIVGIPGDLISSSGTEIRINGAPIPRCRVGAFGFIQADGSSRAGDLWLEALDGSSWLVFHSVAQASIPSGPWTVAPGEVFVLGDNRENSHDSRFWFGGRGGGLPFHLLIGAVRDVGVPALPRGANALKPALAQCTAALSEP